MLNFCLRILSNFRKTSLTTEINNFKQIFLMFWSYEKQILLPVYYILILWEADFATISLHSRQLNFQILMLKLWNLKFNYLEWRNIVIHWQQMECLYILLVFAGLSVKLILSIKLYGIKLKIYTLYNIIFWALCSSTCQLIQFRGISLFCENF